MIASPDRTPLPREFFDRPVLEVAPDLLGRILVRTGMSSAAPRIRSEGWACSTTALSWSTRTTARFNVTVDNGSKLAFSTSVSRIPAHLPCAPAHPLAGWDQLWPGTPRWTTQYKDARP